MNGMEMALNSVMKLLGIDAATVDGALSNIKRMETYAQSVEARLSAIEDNQKRILALLQGDMPTVITATQIEDQKNA